MKNTFAIVIPPLACRAGSKLCVSALAAVLILCGGLSSNAQVTQAPSATDVSPTSDTDTSSTIATASGYDSWTGSIHRSVVDFEVPGAVSEHGLKWVRTYNSSSSITRNGGWSHSYNWYVFGRPSLVGVVFPDGRFGGLGAGSKDRVVRALNKGFFELLLGDGSVVHFDVWTEVYDQLNDGQPPQIVDHVTPV